MPGPFVAPCLRVFDVWEDHRGNWHWYELYEGGGVCHCDTVDEAVTRHFLGKITDPILINPDGN